MLRERVFVPFKMAIWARTPALGGIIRADWTATVFSDSVPAITLVFRSISYESCLAATNRRQGNYVHDKQKKTTALPGVNSSQNPGGDQTLADEPPRVRRRF